MPFEPGVKTHELLGKHPPHRRTPPENICWDVGKTGFSGLMTCWERNWASAVRRSSRPRAGEMLIHQEFSSAFRPLAPLWNSTTAVKSHSATCVHKQILGQRPTAQRRLPSHPYRALCYIRHRPVLLKEAFISTIKCKQNKQKQKKVHSLTTSAATHAYSIG